jgi:hypothetical protein
MTMRSIGSPVLGIQDCSLVVYLEEVRKRQLVVVTVQPESKWELRRRVTRFDL